MQNLRKTNETGRSMVEMLGVLAIVGVLSVGGVYGYGVAMKKHKANELLHQASMLATTISAQIASGKTDLALENFGNSSNGSFSSVKGPDGSTDYQSGDDKFTMQITGMDEAVCKQMQGMKGGTVRSVSCGTPDANGKVTATLTYNKDLSSTPVASDFTTESECKSAGKTWCSAKGGSGACSNSTDCCAGYDSQCCDSETGDISSTESCTTKDGKSTTCSKGKCEFGSKDCMDKECCEAIEGSWKCAGYCDYSECSSSDCICIGKDENGAYGTMAGCVRCDSKDEKIAWPDYGIPVCVDESAGETAVCWWGECMVCTKQEGEAIKGYDEGVGICVNKEAGETGECNGNSCTKCGSDEGILMLPSETGKGICVNKEAGEKGACSSSQCKKCTKEEGTPSCDQNGVCSCIDCSSNPHQAGCCRANEGEWKCDEYTDECICVGKDENGTCGSGRCQKCDKPEQPVVSGYRSFCVDLSTETYICSYDDCVKWNKTNGETGACSDRECTSWNPTQGETGKCNMDFCVKCTSSQGTATCDYLDCWCEK